MPDTITTRSGLQTDYADNTSGAITPQLLRNFVVSTLFYRGAWSSGTYAEFDVVSYQGGLWIALATTTDTPAFSSSNWAPMATNSHPTTLVASTPSAFTINTPGFTTVPLSSTYDPGGNFNNSTYIYTVPVTGIYLILTKFRVTDNVPAYNYGQGAGTADADGSWFAWTNTVTGAGSGSNRNGLQNFRIYNATAGDQIRMYYYWDSNYSTTATAEMDIILLSQ